ncbi:hypothetical protein [Polaribacter sp.]|uniref:hypothetical protein n=1 Tax=Polaribacter sp. TaxID=1920175 RepID=UPI003EF6AEBC
MKKLLPLLFCVLISFTQNGQIKKTIADLYINEANNIIQDRIDFKQALVSFNKALTHMSRVTSTDVAQLGALIYYENEQYKKAKEFVNIYFSLKSQDSSEEYENLLAFKTLIDNQLNNKDSNGNLIKNTGYQKSKGYTAIFGRSRDLNKIESLKSVWKEKSKELVLKVDKIYPFNKNKVALFLKDSYFGILNDDGNIVITADEYKSAMKFDGFILFLNKPLNPTKIFCYNTVTKDGFLLPKVTAFNTVSTHYGRVMLPRANGLLVMYPNKSYETMIYDLNQKKIIKSDEKVGFYNDLQSKKIIQDYSINGKVEKNNKWYDFGGSLGGGIYTLYTIKSHHVDSFLFSASGKVLKTVPIYQYLGAFYNNAIQAIFRNKTIWLNNKGKKVRAPIDEYGDYKGSAKVVELESGFHIIKDNIIVLGEKKLETMDEYIKSQRLQ